MKGTPSFGKRNKKLIYAVDVVVKTHTMHVKSTAQHVDLEDQVRSELTTGKIKS